MALEQLRNEVLWCESTAGGNQTVPPGTTGTTNGQPRNVGAGPDDRFRVFAAADQALTLIIQQSQDGTTWVTTNTSSASTANQGLVLEGNIGAPWIRGRVTNAVACTTFTFYTTLVH